MTTSASTSTNSRPNPRCPMHGDDEEPIMGIRVDADLTEDELNQLREEHRQMNDDVDVTLQEDR